jgi:GTP-binding protein Era
VRDKSRLLPVLEWLARRWPDAELHPVSAATGDGLDSLLQAVLQRLPQGPPMYPEDQLSTVPMRFLASEIVREKLFMKLRQELPYSVAVEVEQWEEDPDTGLVRINAVVYVARRQHKSMVIGRQGAMLKAVGSEARQELEELLDQKVYLELWVKVRQDWTEDEGFLRHLGMAD